MEKLLLSIVADFIKHYDNAIEINSLNNKKIMICNECEDGGDYVEIEYIGKKNLKISLNGYYLCEIDINYMLDLLKNQ